MVILCPNCGSKAIAEAESCDRCGFVLDRELQKRSSDPPQRAGRYVDDDELDRVLDEEVFIWNKYERVKVVPNINIWFASNGRWQGYIEIDDIDYEQRTIIFRQGGWHQLMEPMFKVDPFVGFIYEDMPEGAMIANHAGSDVRLLVNPDPKELSAEDIFGLMLDKKDFRPMLKK